VVDLIEQETIDTPFYVPLGEVLVKGEEEGNDWILFLEASNEMKDQDGETVDSAALRKARDYYLGHGVVSWDHKHRIKDDPGYIIGDPIDIRFEGTRTFAKARLYQFNDIAIKVWKNVKSRAQKLGASIGGGILHKAQSHIKQVIWDDIAVTYKPVNDGTYGKVQMVPFPVFMKAMLAGDGVDVSAFAGGRTLQPESLQGTDHRSRRLEIDTLVRDILDSLIRGRISTYNELNDFVVSRGYSEDVAKRIAEQVSRTFRLNQASARRT